MDPGSVEGVTERLKSWCLSRDRGLARVEWDSAYSQREVIEHLRTVLGDTSVVDVPLPPGEEAHEVATGLIGRLQSLSGSIASITDIEWAFPKHGTWLDTLVALSFQRETLASLPVRQIWWVPSHMTERFMLGVPDLDSWFQLRLHLTEMPPQTGKIRVNESATMSVAEARSMARRFWERFPAARAQGIPEDRIWGELGQPAVDALRSVGLELEARPILARMSNTRDQLERNLTDLRKTWGPDGPEDFSEALQLVRLLKDRGDFAAARELEQGLLEVKTRLAGAEHPETLALMNGLALTLGEQRDDAGARRLHQQVLTTTRQVFGEDHRNTLAAMDNLAATLVRQGDYAPARRLQEQVLEVSSRLFGHEHPDTLRTMNNLARTLEDQGDIYGSRRFQEQVVAGRTRILGSEHPDTLLSMSNLASSLAQQGDYSGARLLHERVLESRKRVLGEEHPQTLLSLVNLAVVLSKSGDRDAAIRLVREALTGRRKVLGEGHPETVGTAALLSRLESGAPPQITL